MVMILSGGRGIRLRPVTDFIPKPLITINNIPIIEWQIRYFKKFGINQFVICSGYKAEQIKNYLDVKNNLDVDIQYSIEKNPLGTGGAIKKASKLISDETFFVMNGDVITNIDLRVLQATKNSIATIPLKTKFGTLKLEDDKITQFNEKKEITNTWMNAGLYYLAKDVIKQLPSKGNIEEITFPKLARSDNLHNVKFNDVFWHSIDSHKDIEECTVDIKKRNYEKFIR